MLMDGITVLYTETNPNFEIIWIFMLVLAILLGVIVGMKEQSVGFGIAYGFIGAMFGLFIGAIASQYISPVMSYGVTIDETVSMVEFTDKYDIIDQKGIVYEITIKQE